jgi:hypothetical protein
MSKDYDGGISTKPFTDLTTAIKSLLRDLHELTFQIALEEHQSSLVDQDKIKVIPGKCAEITNKRKLVEDLIGSDLEHGILKTLTRCSTGVRGMLQPIQDLKEAYEPVITEPTGLPGHC